MKLLSKLAVAALMSLTIGNLTHADQNEAVRGQFNEQYASAKYCASRLPLPYKVSMTEKKNDPFSPTFFKITKDKKTIFSWKGHSKSVFVIKDHILFYAEFSRIASGCMIHAIDLKTGKKRWTTNLKGLGPICHSKYRNAVNLTITKAGLVILGEESSGSYTERLDLKTGKWNYHQVVK